MVSLLYMKFTKAPLLFGTLNTMNSKVESRAEHHLLQNLQSWFHFPILITFKTRPFFCRTLRNSRTRIHRHLFIAMVIQVGIRLIVYTDQAITRSFENSSAGNISSSANLSTTVNETDPTYEKGAYQYRQGIDNTVRLIAMLKNKGWTIFALSIKM